MKTRWFFIPTDGKMGSEKGFTLVELLVSIAVLSIFMAAIYIILLNQTRAYTTQQVAAGAQQNVRMAIELMAADLRLAGLDPLQTAKAGFEVAGATRFRITSDRAPVGQIEANGKIDDANFERITYFFDGTSLRQQLYEGTSNPAPSQSLIDNVSFLSLRYLDQDGAATGILSDIRTVVIELGVQEPAGMDGVIERRYNTRVRCRNVGL